MQLVAYLLVGVLVRQFWDDNPKIHGMYVRPVRMFSDSPICYIGYALYYMMVLAYNCGQVRRPYPSYIEIKKET